MRAPSQTTDALLAVAIAVTARFTYRIGTECQQPSKATWQLRLTVASLRADIS